MSDQTSDPSKTLGGHELETELLADWRLLFSALHGRFETGDFATGLRLVEGIGAVAEELDHHPDVDLTYPRVTVRLTSHDVGGVTSRDVELARRISDLAGSLGAKADPAAVSVLELGLDTWDHEEIKPFWAAVLGYEVSQEHDDELNDPAGTRPTIWFQETERHDEPRQRFHLDLRVPPEVAEDRVRAALAAGGTLVSDERAPTFWVLADAQGNKACVTTWLGRSAAV
ncbi:4a-hydroxytetrahydrobiopterin dehydratase [Nocardioides sp. cx-169]|uniref:4a-hydroxytetrahydrobiopterin dehydratase n=1 Tax=Nocardioides sp. cx-169 TaxID=2899080 RepID=UPI001E5C71FE|nr:4a-hydroxytetrahydrobiopterin dehydratase [Nocardioides sp. cx-169]MCD4536438.1 4a-hydroxytetrahydrobiopterin dehydratase [Nocardioides sp. cx-169]